MLPLSPVDRRSFLRGSALATAGLFVGGAAAHAAPVRRTAPLADVPEAALRRLVEGNARFASGAGTEADRSLARVRSLSAGQDPFAAILTCADSRVPPELIFDQGFGDLFTVRVAGNVAGTEELASLEYAAGVLGSAAIVVLGHSACGAVAAAVDGGPVPGQISALYAHLAPAVAEADGDVETAVEANVRHQAKVVAYASPVVREAVAQGKLAVVGAVYDLDSGRVRFLGEG